MSVVDTDSPACAMRTDNQPGRQEHTANRQDTTHKLSHEFIAMSPDPYEWATTYVKVLLAVSSVACAYALRPSKTPYQMSADVYTLPPPTDGAPVRRLKRVAICIGNEAYSGGDKLPNCAADARAMGKCLKEQVNFDKVWVLTNANKRTIEEKFREMSNEAIDDPGAIVLVYFSGHGREHAGVTYLLPLGMNSKRGEALESQAVSLNDMLEQLDQKTNTANLLFLDCCRTDNSNLERFKTRSQLGTRGPGYLIGLACGYDQKAYSHEGSRHSPYTAELLLQLPKKEQLLVTALKDVRDALRKSTGGAQVSWIHESGLADLVLLPGSISERGKRELLSGVQGGYVRSLSGLTITCARCVKRREEDRNPGWQRKPTVQDGLYAIFTGKPVRCDCGGAMHLGDDGKRDRKLDQAFHDAREMLLEKILPRKDRDVPDSSV